MTVNPNTRPPSMCLGKKILVHPLQEPRCHNKHLLKSRLLKDSSSMEPVCSRAYYLKKEECLFSNMRTFLKSQTDQHKAAAPTRTRDL